MGLHVTPPEGVSAGGFTTNETDPTRTPLSEEELESFTVGTPGPSELASNLKAAEVPELVNPAGSVQTLGREAALEELGPV